MQNPRSLSEFDHFLFDCDDTLYPRSKNVSEIIQRQITHWVRDYFQIDEQAAHELQDRAYRTYGSTLRGLLELRPDLDVACYMQEVFQNTDETLEPDFKLRELLQRIECKKYVFSNGSRSHVHRCLKKLGIHDVFERPIFDVEWLEHENKPRPEAYHRVRSTLNIQDGQRTIFFEDSLANLQTAKQHGWVTVWVKEGFNQSVETLRNEHPYVDYVITDLVTGLPSLFPELQ